MENKLENALNQICLDLTNELERHVSNTPTGICYLLGHCLSEGFSKAGLNAKEVTGHLILQANKDKNVVYGSREHEGENIGDYHTWCELQIGKESIIVDPSIKYNKIAIKKFFNIYVGKGLSDSIICDYDKSNPHTFIEDSSLEHHSKHFLNQIDSGLITNLIKKVEESTILLIDDVERE